MAELMAHTQDGDVLLTAEGSPLLYDLIRHLPDSPDRPCGGKGTCGQCTVMGRGDFLPAPDEKGRIRACCTRLAGKGEIWLPRKSRLTAIESNTRPLEGPLSPMAEGYGAAVDLGTTTIVVELIQLQDGKTLATVSSENPQRVIAADVIGRMEHALAGETLLLQQLVQERVDQMEREAFTKARLPEEKASVRVIAGNTAMLYLFTGRNPSALSAAPFEADCLFGIREKRDLFPRCAGAFVGADITCAVLSSGMCTKEETALLIDLGTNGEIALWHQNHLSCCATAAGPAFEGAGISCGVGSVPGAVDKVWVENGKIAFSTIHGASPCGLCGSGLIDCVAALLDTGALDETGALDDDAVLAEGVTLTQQDIRQVQLAKGAIAAGIQTLLFKEGLSFKDVGVLYIAGGFGSHLNMESAVRIGLIPGELAKKAHVLGNASLGGARQLLLQKESNEEAHRIAQNALCMNLATCPEFSDAFVECMLFE